jgi:hypothetical protein
MSASACDPYNYSSNCSYPSSINSGTHATTSQKVTFNHASRLFTWSFSGLFVNVLLITICLWLLYRFLWRPIQPHIAKLRTFKRLQHTSKVFLEITPYAQTEISQEATQALYAVLAEVIGSKATISLEYAATRDQGTRFLISASKADSMILQRKLASLSATMQIRVLDTIDSLEETNTNSYQSIMELGQARHYAFPMQKQSDASKHDLVSYITTAMAKLEADEAISMQLITSAHITRSTNRLHGKLLHNEHLSLDHRMRHFIMTRWWVWLVALGWSSISHNILSVCIVTCVAIAASFTLRTPFLKLSKVTLSSGEQRLYDQMLEKLAEPLFQVDIRILIKANSQQRTTQLVTSIYSSLAALNTAGYQKLIIKRCLPPNYGRQLLRYEFHNRLPSPLMAMSCILSASELASIYHFPNSRASSEGMIQNHSRQLPAPLSLKLKDTKLDITFGVNHYHGETVMIGQTRAQRQKHTYIIGKTGMGKTTILKSAIYQDMCSGNGLALLDAHGDMFKELLEIIPEERMHDVIVFDPSDREWPIGLNLLDPGIDFATDEDRIEWITSTVVSVFKKLAGEQQWGQRMEHVLNNATMTALQLPQPSLMTIQRLLTEKKYQRQVAKTLEDPVLKQFWLHEFALLNNKQLSSEVSPLTHRLAHFITRKMSRHILLQSKSTVRIGDIMNQGKILLVNLSKGDLGADQSEFFGTVITAFFWMAAYQRTKVPESERPDFFLYVDEFQNFATSEFAQITSEGRKFHIALTVSHQNTAQIHNKDLLRTMAANAHSIITMKAGPDDEQFIIPYLKPAVMKGDIVGLAPYNFYMTTLNDGTEEAFSGTTMPLKVIGSSDTKDRVSTLSRLQYATPIAEVERQMEIVLGSQQAETTKIAALHKLAQRLKSESIIN